MHINKILINGDIGGVLDTGVVVDGDVVGPGEDDVLPSFYVMPIPALLLIMSLRWWFLELMLE